MKRILIGLGMIIIAGIGYWLISPFFIDKKVSEEFPTEVTATNDANPTAHLSGSFAGFDRIHYGSGDVNVYKTAEGYVIRFEENFNVANGPDLYVGLGRNGKYIEEAQLEKLKGNIGSQNYLVPQNINLEDYNEIWIWCRAFSVGFAKAELK